MKIQRRKETREDIDMQIYDYQGRKLLESHLTDDKNGTRFQLNLSEEKMLEKTEVVEKEQGELGCAYIVKSW